MRSTLLAAAFLLLAGCSSKEREERLRAAGPNPSVEALQKVAKASEGAKLFGQCARCHTIGEGGQNLAGPNLHGIMGAPIAGNPRYGYTDALKAVEGNWTTEAMDAWLEAPHRVAPGNKMAYPGLADPLARADLIAYLRSNAR